MVYVSIKLFIRNFHSWMLTPCCFSKCRQNTHMAHTRIYVSLFLFTCIRLCAFKLTFALLHVQIFPCMHTYIHTHTYIHIYIYLYTHMSLWIFTICFPSAWEVCACCVHSLCSELRVYDSIPSYGNPRFFQTLLDEDMMRRMKEILSGVHTAVYSLRGLEHYCVSVCLRLVKGIMDVEA